MKLKKKIVSVCIGSFITFGVILSLFLSNNTFDASNMEDQSVTQQVDVIMPTKVSRPGCEKTQVCYVPSIITINKGESVTWKNEDSAFHSVTSGFYDEPSGLFDSGYLDPYQSFSFVFDNYGTFDYYCTLHPWMAGQILVR